MNNDLLNMRVTMELESIRFHVLKLISDHEGKVREMPQDAERGGAR